MSYIYIFLIFMNILMSFTQLFSRNLIVRNHAKNTLVYFTYQGKAYGPLNSKGDLLGFQQVKGPEDEIHLMPIISTGEMSIPVADTEFTIFMQQTRMKDVEHPEFLPDQRNVYYKFIPGEVFAQDPIKIKAGTKNATIDVNPIKEMPKQQRLRPIREEEEKEREEPKEYPRQVDPKLLPPAKAAEKRNGANKENGHRQQQAAMKEEEIVDYDAPY